MWSNAASPLVFYALQPCPPLTSYINVDNIHRLPPPNTTLGFACVSDCNMMTAAAALHAGKTEDAHTNGRDFVASLLYTTRLCQHGKGDFSSTYPTSSSCSANLWSSWQPVSRQLSTTHAACCRLSKQEATAWNGLVVPSTRSPTRPTLRAPHLLARNGMHYSYLFVSSCSSFPRGGGHLSITDIDHEPYRHRPNSGWRRIPSPTSL
jgi:hypothetical protein